MTKFEVGQKVFIPGIISRIDEDEYQDLRIAFEDGDNSYFNSKKVNILTEPPQPKSPAPVRLYGKTIFDLHNCMEIGDINCHKHEYTIVIQIMRGERADSVYFEFETQEEATEAREVIEKKVLEAKGIGDAKN